MPRKQLLSYRRIPLMFKRGLSLLFLAGLALVATWVFHTLPIAIAQPRSPLLLPIPANFSKANLVEKLPLTQILDGEAAQLLEEGKILYQKGQFIEAARVWERSLQLYQERNDNAFERAQVLSYLSLAYQQMSNWTKADAVLTESLQLLEAERGKSLSIEQLKIFARILNARGRLQLTHGNFQAALDSWKEAGDIYQNVGDEIGVTGNLLNQAQALQSLGRYRLALKRLTEVQQRLEKQPDSAMEFTLLRSLANALRAVGDLQRSEEILKRLNENSPLQSPGEKSAILLNLGNTERDLGDRERVLKQNSPSVTPFGCAIADNRGKIDLNHYNQAINYYREAVELDFPATRLQAKLNYLSLQVMLANISSEATQKEEGRSMAQTLWPEIEAELQDLPQNSATAYAQINFVQSLACLGKNDPQAAPSVESIDKLLEKAVLIGKAIGDRRIEAYALGKLGGLYEMAEDWKKAEIFTQEALNLARSIQAGDIAYQWEWQWGRLLKVGGKNEEAIAAYEAAVNTIESFRPYLGAIAFDLKDVSSGIQFDFRDKVEPVYRQLVELLLQISSKNQPSSEKIERARNYIQQLQVAELESFLLCDLRQTRNKEISVENLIDRHRLKTAIIYPIILNAKISVILKIPGNKNLLYYPPIADQSDVLNTLDSLQKSLVKPGLPRREVRNLSQKVYNWVIVPKLREELEKSQVKTLVFVLDSQLRNLPMAALYDGKEYLLQNYAVAIGTGLPLQDTRPLSEIQINGLVAGLENPQGTEFGRLEYVRKEVEEIQPLLNNPRVLFDQEFTRSALRQEINSSSFNLLHLATHGKFSSNPKETFIITAPGERVNANELDNLLQASNRNLSNTIELLVLSACQTAAGDNRAALGLAGVAVRAGAGSTLATLWNVNDPITAEFMKRFYEKIINDKVSKAEALRLVQQELVKEDKEPREWAPYILVGNWR